MAQLKKMTRKPKRKIAGHGGARPGAGRPAHKPTGVQRTLAKTLFGCGLKRQEVALLMEISPATIDRHYETEKEIGALSMDTTVVRALFQNCTADGGSVAAQIYWTKARLGWSDRLALPAPEDLTPTIRDSDFVDPKGELIRRLEQMAKNISLNKTVFGPMLDITPDSVEASDPVEKKNMTEDMEIIAHITACSSHCDPDITRGKRRRIVDTVTNHNHGFPGVFQVVYILNLGFRKTSSTNGNIHATSRPKKEKRLEWQSGSKMEIYRCNLGMRPSFSKRGLTQTIPFQQAL